MNKDEIYIIITDKVNPKLSFGEAIRDSTYTTTNFKKAYENALSLGEIHDPSIGYRAALERVSNQYAAQIDDKSTPRKVTIARIKKL